MQRAVLLQLSLSLSLSVCVSVSLSFPTHCQFPVYRLAPPTSSNPEERFNLESYKKKGDVSIVVKRWFKDFPSSVSLRARGNCFQNAPSLKRKLPRRFGHTGCGQNSVDQIWLK